jgi:hypothetical protein
VDTVLGRIAFAAPTQDVDVMFHAGFSDDLGGRRVTGRRRSLSGSTLDTTVAFQFGITQDADTISNAPDPTVLGTAMQDAIDAWNTFVAQGVPGFGVICVMDSRVYAGTVAIEVPAGYTLAIVAADWPVDTDLNQRQPGVFGASECWPTLTGDVQVTGTAPADSESPGTLILDGLRMSGADRHRQAPQAPAVVTAVVPWTDLGPTCVRCPRPGARGQPRRRLPPRSGALHPGRAAQSGRGARAPVSCILDATATFVAFAAPDGTDPAPWLTLVNCTVVGKVRTAMLELASSCLFVAELAVPDPDWTAPVRSERRQHGCVRFSRLPEGARVPGATLPAGPRAAGRARELGLDTVDALPAGERERVVLRMLPMFTSLTYGDPGYAQLSRRGAVAIREGGADGAEMGAFHDLFQAHREQNLRTRLDEYLRFGLEAGVFYET